MKLTHESVRGALHAIDNPDDACAYDKATLRALCEEWLAQRTVRWADDSDERFGRLYCDAPHWYGFFVRRVDRFDARVNEQRGIDAEEATLDTLAEARAWLEARAREAGYEVAR